MNAFYGKKLVWKEKLWKPENLLKSSTSSEDFQEVNQGRYILQSLRKICLNWRSEDETNLRVLLAKTTIAMIYGQDFSRNHSATAASRNVAKVRKSIKRFCNMYNKAARCIHIRLGRMYFNMVQTWIDPPVRSALNFIIRPQNLS